MKTTLISFFLVTTLLTSNAQEGVLNIQNDSAQVFLESLDITIEVIGDIATTVTKMTFYNPNDRILEGELNFPLAEGQNVFRFAMDINGKLREGVIVEKNLGRKAFEGVVRQTIDPGLLEKTVGNNYKTRVYPIPAMGRKTVLVGYEEELTNSITPIYQLIAEYGKVKEFQLKIEVINQEFEPKIRPNELVNLKFEKWRSSYLAELRKENFYVTGTFSFEIPWNIEEQVFRQDSSTYDFFYISTFPKVVKTKKEFPSSLAIIWDASKSLINRDTAKEFNLIRNYIETISNVNVHVISFSNEIIEKRNFQIVNGNVDKLIYALSKITYDGGTSFKSVQLEKLKYEEILFFTDGIPNLDKLTETEGINTVHVITTTKSNDSDFSKYLSKETSGNFINLLNTSLNDALEILTNVQYQFLSATFNPKRIEEVYPIGPVSIKENSAFSIAGKIKSNKEVTITLNFGLQGKIFEKRKVIISKELYIDSIDRLWANKKVASLLENINHDPNTVINIGKTYGLVTPYTSLIVLDRVEDYVRFEIEPPIELKIEYDLLLSQKAEETKLSENEIIELVLEDYQDRMNWWKEDRKDTVFTAPKQNETIENTNNNPSNQEAQDESQNEGQIVNSVPQPEPTTVPEPILSKADFDTTIFNQIIEGRVFGEEGELLIGATVLIKGATIGTVTDLNGAYKIRVRENDALVISYVGYSTEEILIGNISNVDITLQVGQMLSEVVVTAMGVDITKANMNFSSTKITDLLSGRIAGVDIQNTEDSTLIIRGNSTIRVGRNPIYIIDGEIASAKEYNWLNPDEIASTNLIKGENAIAIYGNSANDGVIVIMTKNALEGELVLPDSITSAFDPDFLIKEWEPDEPYIDSLKNTPREKQYEVYLKLRAGYGKAPSFYLGVGKFFIQNNQENIGLRILSNIVELDLENHELLKILAQKYLQIGQLETSIFLFNRILDLRPDEPQSKRDLALAYQENGEYQKALDIFNEIILTEGIDLEDRFPLIKSTVLYEMNNMISAHKKELDLSKISKDLIIAMPVDIRVVLDWINLETDLDLWVIEPNGEKCNFSNDLTKIGGRLTEDYVDGYGPEEYILKNAMPGEYKIEVDYFDERVQKISGSVTLQVSIFTNYGSKNQQVKRLTRELRGVEDVIEIGKFNWKK